MSTSTSESPSGSQDLYGERSLNNLPTEILFVLFECCAPKDIVRCRQVCSRWRDIIDTILHNDTKWEQFCKHDFPKTYEGAMWKTPDIESWFEMYRTLSLWSSLDKAQESVEEFCHSDPINERMLSVTMQKKGLILVHKRCRVVYYDLLSTSVAERKGVSGQFHSLVELEDIVILGLYEDIYIVRKPHKDWHSDLLTGSHQYEAVFNDVKKFFVENRTVFFINLNCQLYAFHLDNRTLTLITLRENMEQLPGSVAIGFKNECMYILTMDKELYSYDKSISTLKCKLDTSTNLMNCLYQHNMLDSLDWRFYYIFLDILQQKQHTGLLHFIRKVQAYGDDLIFVATQSTLNIYYKPFVDGELDLMRFPPIKSCIFSDHIEIPIVSMNAVKNIHIVETKKGHVILVCMPRKIQVITYSNEHTTPESTAIIPYVPQ